MGSFFIKFYFFASVAVEEVAEEVSNASFFINIYISKIFFYMNKKNLYFEKEEK